MPKFNRRFDVEALAKWDQSHPGNAVRALFERWALPGQRTGRKPLRVGIRDGYLNMYVNGQSVARLSMRDGCPEVSIHQAYYDGRIRDRANPDPREQRYVHLDQKDLASASTVELIDGWIATADDYAGGEKKLVDRLIRANAGIIDLEMGLPADVAGSGPRTAPRMDLVVLQGPYGGPYTLAFWEVKLTTNPELRARADYVEDDGRWVSGPRVIHQLRKYQSWMAGEGRLADVAAAYGATAQYLLGLHRLFGSQYGPRPDCVRIWETVVASGQLDIVLPPGLVVGHTLDDPERPALGAHWEEICVRLEESFRPHRRKLEQHAIKVCEIGLDTLGSWLPVLTSGQVTA